MAKRIHAFSNVSTNIEPDEIIADNGLFGNGNMFVMYVKEVVTYPGVEEPQNIYALKNERSFTMPAFSAMYVLAPNYELPSTNNFFGWTVIANTTDQPIVVKAGSIDFSLLQIYSDNWGTSTSPDGKIEIMRSRGPYIRLATLDGPFDESKPLSEYNNLDRIIEPGDWFTVRHRK